MQLAVFVVHDCRPWLSVTGTCVAGSRLRRVWIRELVTGERRFARYGFWGSQLPHHSLTGTVDGAFAGARDPRHRARLLGLEAHHGAGGDVVTVLRPAATEMPSLKN